MGLFWDLLQQSQISEQRGKADNLDIRVRQLEGELQRVQRTLHNLVVLLEERFGEDIDRDGKIAYAGKQGPWGFKPKAAERALKKLLKRG